MSGLTNAFFQDYGKVPVCSDLIFPDASVIRSMFSFIKDAGRVSCLHCFSPTLDAKDLCFATIKEAKAICSCVTLDAKAQCFMTVKEAKTTQARTIQEAKAACTMAVRHTKTWRASQAQLLQTEHGTTWRHKPSKRKAEVKLTSSPPAKPPCTPAKQSSKACW